MAEGLSIAKKIDTFRSPFYVECVKKYECILCRLLLKKINKRHIDPHHVDGRGKAGVGSDGRIVPACREKHHPASPLAFKEMCRKHGLDPEDLIRETQQRFCEDHGYVIGRDGDTLEDILVKAELGQFYNPGHRVSNGTAESKGKKLPGTRGLSKKCGTPDNPLIEL